MPAKPVHVIETGTIYNLSVRVSIQFCCDKLGFGEVTGDLIRQPFGLPPSPEGKAFGACVSWYSAFPFGEGGRSEAEVG